MDSQGDGTEELDCAEITYRALKKKWIEEQPILADAFLRRVKPSGIVEDAISLSRQKYSTAKECRQKLDKMPGVASLHVGRVRSVSIPDVAPVELDVIPKPVSDESGTIVEPGHCELTGLPHPQTEQEAAERAASRLRDMARIISRAEEELEHSRRRPS